MQNDPASRSSLTDLLTRNRGQMSQLRIMASTAALLDDATMALDVLTALAAYVDELHKAVAGGKVEIPLGVPMEKVERILFSATLIEAKWNKSLAAKLLGLSRRTVYNRLVALGKEQPEETRACARCYRERGPWRYYNLCEPCYGAIRGEQQLAKKQQRAAIQALLLRGASVGEVANATRCSRQAIERLLKLPEKPPVAEAA